MAHTKIINTYGTFGEIKQKNHCRELSREKHDIDYDDESKYCPIQKCLH